MNPKGKHAKSPIKDKDAQDEKAKEKNIAKEILEWIISAVIAIAVVFLLQTYVIQPVRVEGASMEPTLYNNERMLVSKFTYRFNEIERGDIVVTHFPNDKDNYVKRIIGLEGDKIKSLNGQLYINDEQVDEPYIKDKMLVDFKETIIPEGRYFVMGDNRNNSRDSRSVGFLDKSMIMGKVQMVIWPIGEVKIIEHYNYNELGLKN